jgi:16S rRNA (guanine527-N7)-methyltransferase
VTPQQVADRLNVSRETLQKLSSYVALLEKWQPRINLVSAATLPDIWQRHILDSGQLAAHMPVHTQKILDIGSGAGFPGLVLSIIGDWHVQLVESDQRKAVFLQTVIRELGLTAKVSNCRIEAVPPAYPDVITARALAAMPKLMHLITPQLHSRLTCLFLKGGSVEEELTSFHSYSTMTPQLYPSLSCDDGVIVKLTMPL